VVVVAFGRAGGYGGPLPLRLLAERQKGMLTIIRAHVQARNRTALAETQR
jgi:hypothetical protein